MNAVLIEKLTAGWHIARWNAGETFTFVSLVQRGGLLFIAAQAGFVDGPARHGDTWRSTLGCRTASPRSPSASAMQNGVLIMGGTSVAALLYTHGDVSNARRHVFDVNVFLTFLLSEFRDEQILDSSHRKEHPTGGGTLPASTSAVSPCV